MVLRLLGMTDPKEMGDSSRILCGEGKGTIQKGILAEETSHNDLSEHLTE